MIIKSAYAAGGPASQVLNNFNNAIHLRPTLNSPANILMALLPNIFVIGGLGLFIMTVIAGVQLALSVNNPDAAEAAKKRLTVAIIGFLLIFSAYWLAQALQIILGIPIVSG